MKTSELQVILLFINIQYDPRKTIKEPPLSIALLSDATIEINLVFTVTKADTGEVLCFSLNVSREMHSRIIDTQVSNTVRC